MMVSEYGPVLDLPSDARALHERLTMLLGVIVKTPAEMIEQAAIAHLIASGVITLNGVRALAADLFGLRSELEHGRDTAPAVEQLDKWVFAPATEAWRALERTLAGERLLLPVRPVEVNDGHDPGFRSWQNEERVRGRAFLAMINDQLGKLIIQHVLTIDNVIEHLPDSVVSTLLNRAAKDCIDGPYGLGASLYDRPHTTVKEGLIMPGTSHDQVTLDALATVVQNTCIDMAAARELGHTGRFEQLGQHLHLWWCMLKGFLYALVHHTVEMSPVWRAADLVYATKMALTTGHRCLRDYDVPETNWRDSTSERGMAIAAMPVETLIAQFNEKLAEWRRYDLKM